MPYVLAGTLLEIAGTLAGAAVADLTGALIGWLLALALGALWVSWRNRAGNGSEPEHPPPIDSPVPPCQRPVDTARSER
jgi:hypothetical protein